MTIPILLYHKVDFFEWGGTWIPPMRFESQMRWLSRRGYRTLTPDELIQEIGTGRQGDRETDSMKNEKVGATSWLRPNDKETGSVLITFDDGYEDIYDNAYPILQKFGFTGAIFLVTDYIGKHNLWDVNVGMKRFKHMGWDKIREMQRANFVFGSHTVTHPDLTKLNRKEIKKELEISKKAIEDKLGQEVKFLSYPFGKQNETVRRIAEEIGYKACFTSNPFSIDRFAIGRMGIYIIDTMSEFAIKSEGREDFFYTLEGVKGNIINYFSKGTAIWKNRCQVIGVRHLKRLRLSFKGCATRLGGCLPWDDERNEQRPRSTNDEHLKPNT